MEIKKIIWEQHVFEKAVCKMSAILLKRQCLNVLTHCGRVTQYDDGSMLCKNPTFFIMTKMPTFNCQNA